MPRPRNGKAPHQPGVVGNVCQVRKDKRRNPPAPETVDTGDVPVTRGPVPKGFPSEVKSLGQRWEVVYSPNLQSRNLYGSADPGRHRILIDSAQAREAMVETLLHEICHVMIRNTHLSYELEYDEEERLVRALAPQILDMLRGNKPWWT